MAEIIATDIEIIVLRWLDKRGIIYDFQTSLAGGRFELGGSVVDILIHDLDLAWRIQGRYWHEGVAKKGMDDIQRESLEAMGWTVVDIWSDDLETPAEVNETLTMAIQGQEVLH